MANPYNVLLWRSVVTQGQVWTVTSVWVLEPSPRLNLTHYSLNASIPKLTTPSNKQKGQKRVSSAEMISPACWLAILLWLSHQPSRHVSRSFSLSKVLPTLALRSSVEIWLFLFFASASDRNFLKLEVSPEDNDAPKRRSSSSCTERPSS